MRAARKATAVWTLAEAGVEAGAIAEDRARRKLERLFIPVENARCEFIAGDTPQVQAANLAQRLHEAKVL
jgi:electron transfer flavoprotein alpha/beta subunit